MTDKEVRRLKRAELLEILFYMQKEMDGLRQENENLRQQLNHVSTAGSLSDADFERIAAEIKTAVQDAMRGEQSGQSEISGVSDGTGA